MQLTKLIWAFGMGAAALAGQSQASDQGHGTVKFTGSIIDAPCSITPETIEQTVDLGEISNKSLLNGGKSNPRPFDIKLESCDLSGLTDKTVTITFTGPESSVQPGYLAIVGSSASGAAIGITNDEGTNIPLGTASSATKTQQGDNTLTYSAYLKGNGGSTTVVPGSFTSVANFTLAYQ
ncbi:fimbrial protein [Yersinia bercovieri]|uniref:fimbrial protein n=1 Tax=Yersinia bercovieri TaxID=634 RepID=UPI00119D796A|nr:fimbrial protein [Yersinia bercovieri]